jgi:hypothetical protein
MVKVIMWQWRKKKQYLLMTQSTQRAINAFRKRFVRMLVIPKTENILWQVYLPRYPFVEKKMIFLPKIIENSIMRVFNKKINNNILLMRLLQAKRRV